MTLLIQKFNIFLIFGLILISSNISFGQTADKTEGCSPMVVNFTAPSDSTSFYWDFDDGATAVTANPSHTFTQVKTHNVIFKESQNGAVVGTITIKIYPKPIPSFTTIPESGCQPLDVAFNNTSTVNPSITVTNYNWVFGDGTGDTGTPNPNHQYVSTGEFTVGLQLITDKAGCDTTIAVPNLIKVSNPPAPTFATNPNPAVACDAPLNVTFTNTTPPGLN